MSVEIEVKFRVDDLFEFRRKLVELGGNPQVSKFFQRDTYYQHPVRDFSVSDEALRVRVDDAAYLTYKGPKLDPQSKTREEIEVRLPGPEEMNGVQTILNRLGFTPVRTVSKIRESSTLVWKGIFVEVSIDDVEDVGVYVELEAKDKDLGVIQMRDALLEIAGRLGLHEQERRSYLELLLSQAP